MPQPVRRSRLSDLGLVLALTAALTACGQTTSPGGTGAAPSSTAPTSSPDGDETTTPEDTVRTSDLTPVSPEPEQPTGPGALPTGPVPDGVAERPEVRDAVAAEAQRRGVDVSAVTIAGWADVTWPDGSLGCPEPGMMYTQALVPGHQLVLEVDGELASYHAARDEPFSYCASPTAPATGGADSR